MKRMIIEAVNDSEAFKEHLFVQARPRGLDIELGLYEVDSDVYFPLEDYITLDKAAVIRLRDGLNEYLEELEND